MADGLKVIIMLLSPTWAWSWAELGNFYYKNDNTCIEATKVAGDKLTKFHNPCILFTQLRLQMLGKQMVDIIRVFCTR